MTAFLQNRARYRDPQRGSPAGVVDAPDRESNFSR
jgi:hypothetical protein